MVVDSGLGYLSLQAAVPCAARCVHAARASLANHRHPLALEELNVLHWLPTQWKALVWSRDSIPLSSVIQNFRANS